MEAFFPCCSLQLVEAPDEWAVHCHLLTLHPILGFHRVLQAATHPPLDHPSPAQLVPAATQSLTWGTGKFDLKACRPHTYAQPALGLDRCRHWRSVMCC